jgi:hypothetical protein
MKNNNKNNVSKREKSTKTKNLFIIIFLIKEFNLDNRIRFKR